MMNLALVVFILIGVKCEAFQRAEIHGFQLDSCQRALQSCVQLRAATVHRSNFKDLYGFGPAQIVTYSKDGKEEKYDAIRGYYDQVESLLVATMRARNGKEYDMIVDLMRHDKKFFGGSR